MSPPFELKITWFILESNSSEALEFRVGATEGQDGEQFSPTFPQTG